MYQNRLCAPAMSRRSRAVDALYSSVAGLSALMISMQVVFAEGDDIWSRLSTMLQDIYGKLMGFTTILAVLMVVIALIIRMCSHDQKSIDNATKWVKSVVFCWIAVNSIGAILAYLQPLVTGMQYTPA